VARVLVVAGWVLANPHVRQPSDSSGDATTGGSFLQNALDGLAGRALRLTADGARLLRGNESMRTTVLTGGVRTPETGRIAGQLSFIDPVGVACLAPSIPSSQYGRSTRRPGNTSAHWRRRSTG